MGGGKGSDTRQMGYTCQWREFATTLLMLHSQKMRNPIFSDATANQHQDPPVTSIEHTGENISAKRRKLNELLMPIVQIFLIVKTFICHNSASNLARSTLFGDDRLEWSLKETLPLLHDLRLHSGTQD